MSKQVFPYDGWVLMPSFKPVQVTFVADSHGSFWHMRESGRQYCALDIYQSKQAAIAAGRAALDEQQVRLNKKQAHIEKRWATLDKAESS